MKEYRAKLELLHPGPLIPILSNTPANLENSTVATELEKINFHSSPKEGDSKVRGEQKIGTVKAEAELSLFPI